MKTTRIAARFTQAEVTAIQAIATALIGRGLLTANTSDALRWAVMTAAKQIAAA